MNKSGPRKRILVIEDDLSFYNELEIGLSAYSLEHTDNLTSAAIFLRNQNFDLVLLDLNLSDNENETEELSLEGLEYIKTIRTKYPILPIIVMSKVNKVDVVSTAIQYGANEYFYKPDRIYKLWRSRIEILTDEKRSHEIQFPFIGESEHFQQLKLKLRNLANKNEHLLFSGDIGVGKTTAAHFYHKSSHRSYQPFTNLDLSIYDTEEDVETIFNHVKNGIFYIKSIDTISQRAQAFLFESITKQKSGGAKANIQFLASTTRDIKEMVNDQTFRSDLFFAFTPVEILPLKERRDDIAALLDFYLREEVNVGINQLIESEAKRMLLQYDYPDNVSGLIRTVKSMLSEKKLQGKPKVDPDCLPREIVYPNQGKKAFELTEFRKARAKVDLDFVEMALRQTYGQKGKAAKLMGLKPDDMRYMISRHFKDYPDLFSDYPQIKNAYKL